MISVHVQLDRYRDAALAAFEETLSKIVQKAQDETLDFMVKNLEVVDGVITRTPANLSLIRRMGKVFMSEMESAGYTSAVNAFVASFPGSLPTIQKMLNQISETLKVPLPDLAWTTGDLNLFKSVAVSTSKHITDLIKAEATKAVNRTMFSLGGMPFKQMVDVIRDGFGTTVGRAKTLADTSQAMFYRVALERQYEKIENESEVTLSYRYTGPNDNKCRLFCHNLKNSTKQVWTRPEIDSMTNGQMPNVFVTCGGFNCRHQWDIAATK